jgi:thiamine-phosphate pyrophosphorylase
MKSERDYSLYLVTDRDMIGSRSLSDMILAAVRGGVSIVQLREKKCSTREYVELAITLKSLLADSGVPLIINDRIDVVMASGADGVHVGQSDMPYPVARKILGPGAIIGLTIESEEQALAAEQLDADYLGVSTIFPTPTKTDTEFVWGVEGLKKLRAISRHQLVAIGGLNTSNAAEIISTGADGVAVVSAICGAEDPESSARELRKIIDFTRRGKRSG